MISSGILAFAYALDSGLVNRLVMLPAARASRGLEGFKVENNRCTVENNRYKI
jgi:hypothetical protein